MRFLFAYLLFLLCLPGVRAGSPYSLLVATYNVENLFDTINDPGVPDPVLAPEPYRTKLRNLSRVIGELGPDILGLCEIEKGAVVSDLLQTEPLREKGYRFVHYDSPDPRGMDVALVYRSDRLRLVNAEPIAAPDRYSTRDVLRVELRPLEDTARRIVCYVLHLPSRRGNNSRTTRMRERIVDRIYALILAEHPATGVVVMGDLNDNPTSKLITQRLPTLSCLTAVPYRKGQGSYAWRDTWLMYDNILVNSVLQPEGEAQVFVRPWMLTPDGRFRGYPYRNVFSDHLPVYVRLRW